MTKFGLTLGVHYSDVIMGSIAPQITSLAIVCSSVYWGADQRKTSKLRVTGLCAGNSPVTGEFPAQRDSNAENVSIWWRHHVIPISHRHMNFDRYSLRRHLGIGISINNLRRSSDRHRFIMGIPIPLRRRLFSEWRPWGLSLKAIHWFMG